MEIIKGFTWENHQFARSVCEFGGNPKLSNKSKAFTLAEILVTLVIVGVVSALTIPSVITNYQKHQTEVKVKKVYSMLNEAFNMAQAEYGDKKTWDWSNKMYSYNNANNNAWAKKYLFSFLKGEEDKDSFAFMTADGIGINVYGFNQPYFIIEFDINGSKKPNAYGKDKFSTYFFKEKGFGSAYDFQWTTGLADWIKAYSRESAINKCRSYDYKTSFCLDLIMLNGWKIPNDYPW